MGNTLGDMKRNQKYNDYVEQMKPKHNLFINASKAFIVGGIICVIGHYLQELFMHVAFPYEVASAYSTLVLILISVILTGFNLVVPIVKFAGAGFLVPITGFANSVASCAIEFKKEGQVFGIGCKIFTIAGPVILYGIVTSSFFGALYYFIMQSGI